MTDKWLVTSCRAVNGEIIRAQIALSFSLVGFGVMLGRIWR